VHHFIIISLLALGLVGCRHAPYPATAAALQIWRSPHSSPQQRADAVNKLIPPGTRIEEVEGVLGKKGVWKRFRDPPVFRYVYELPDGGVSLEFESSMAFGDRFWTASPIQTLFGLPVRYHNAQYDLTLFLPSTWRGHSVKIQKWEGYPTKTEHGPIIVLRHPQWRTNDLYQDIPIMVFTRKQWDEEEQGRFFPYAGGVIFELWHNQNYVFGLYSRYNAYDEVSGWKAAADIVERNCAANDMPHLYPK
jgi:hypothetical protein